MHYFANKITYTGDKLREHNLNIAHVFSETNRKKRPEKHIAKSLIISKTDTNQIVLHGFSKEISDINQLWKARKELKKNLLTYRALSCAIKDSLKNIQSIAQQNNQYLKDASVKELV